MTVTGVARRIAQYPRTAQHLGRANRANIGREAAHEASAHIAGSGARPGCASDSPPRGLDLLDPPASNVKRNRPGAQCFKHRERYMDASAVG